MDIGRTAIVVCFAIVLLAAIWDFLSSRIPNFLTLGGMLLGLAMHTATGWVDGGLRGGFYGFLSSITGITVCAIVPLLGFARKEMGGGDVKLLAAIGALCGPVIGFQAQAFSFGILFLLVLPWRFLKSNAFRDIVHNAGVLFKNAVSERKLPYLNVRKMPPVVLAPSILLGFSLAVARHGIWP